MGKADTTEAVETSDSMTSSDVTTMVRKTIESKVPTKQRPKPPSETNSTDSDLKKFVQGMEDEFQTLLTKAVSLCATGYTASLETSFALGDILNKAKYLIPPSMIPKSFEKQERNKIRKQHILLLRYEGKSILDISKILKISVSTVSVVTKGIPRGGEKIQKMIALRQKGKSLEEIAKTLNISVDEVRGLAKSNTMGNRSPESKEDPKPKDDIGHSLAQVIRVFQKPLEEAGFDLAPRTLQRRAIIAHSFNQKERDILLANKVPLRSIELLASKKYDKNRDATLQQIDKDGYEAMSAILAKEKKDSAKRKQKKIAKANEDRLARGDRPTSPIISATPPVHKGKKGQNDVLPALRIYHETNGRLCKEDIKAHFLTLFSRVPAETLIEIINEVIDEINAKK